VRIENKDDSSACPTCSGYGFITVDRADRRGEHETVDENCPDCEGDGRSPREDSSDELYVDLGGEGGCAAECGWEVRS
jgi:DnaJ-class molecular chaperone